MVLNRDMLGAVPLPTCLVDEATTDSLEVPFEATLGCCYGSVEYL